MITNVSLLEDVFYNFFRGLFPYTRAGRAFTRGICIAGYETAGTVQCAVWLGNTCTLWSEKLTIMAGILSMYFSFSCSSLVFHE